MKYVKFYDPLQGSVNAGDQLLSGEVTKESMDQFGPTYQQESTRQLVALVKDATALVRARGEEAFSELRLAGSRWRQGETYIFVLDTEGNMLVHADPELEGKNQVNLKDINGKPIIRGLIDAAMKNPDKPEGWYHYEWPIPGGLLPRWKSSYVQLVKAPSGKEYIIGSGMYNDSMEREFIVEMVTNAVKEIEKRGEAAFELFRDPTGPYRAKDAYIFVMDTNGVELFNPVFTNLEGQNLLDVKDTQGKFIDREILKVQTKGSGWVDHMWPKPGESVPTQVSTYVSAANLNGKRVVVGSGVYLADAPKAVPTTPQMTAAELVSLVSEAAAMLEQKGEEAFPEMRRQGSKWFHDEIYFWVWSMEGVRIFHPEVHTVKREVEGKDIRDAKDLIGKPYGKMFLETAASPEGEGWIHCMWPKPFEIFPSWKSCFVKRVTFPSGKQYLTGSGIYNMQVDKALITDLVNRAANLVAQQGKDAFPLLRDKKGPFLFMDVYVFVDNLEGVELVNPAQPSLEGRNLMQLADAQGKFAAREYIAAADKKGSAWIDYMWYKPGKNEPARKYTYVRKVKHGKDTYIVGSGLYESDEAKKAGGIRKLSWESVDREKMSETLTRQVIFGEKGTLVQFTSKQGTIATRHFHSNEEYVMVTSGALKFTFDDREEVIRSGDILVIPPSVPHSITVLEDGVFIDFFAPAREDWLQGKDQYLRQ